LIFGSVGFVAALVWLCINGMIGGKTAEPVITNGPSVPQAAVPTATPNI
jgi:hypothetical protein